MRRRKLGVRVRLLLAVVAAVAVALAIGVVAANVLLGQRLSASATDLVRAQAETERSSLRVENGRVSAPPETADGAVASQVWVFAGGRTLEAPRTAAEVDAAARSLRSSAERTLDVRERVRLYALPIVEDGARYGTVVSAVSLDPYEETGRAALFGSLLLAVALLGAVAAASWWMLGRALLPVSRMTEDAEAWSARDLDRRFGLGEPYDELTHLAATLDALLERIAAGIRHEQRFAAELSHELRTPLARAKGQTELMLRRERAPADYRTALEAIDRNVDEMTRTVDALMAAARHEAGLTHEASDVAEAIRATVAATPPRPRVPVRVHVPERPVRVSADHDLLVRMVQPLVDNACRYGRSAVDVSVAQVGSSAEVEVADDGPGVTADERERIFEPGARGSAGRTADGGAGLGLALARRLARSVGGDITAGADAPGGRFTLRLPLA